MFSMILTVLAVAGCAVLMWMCVRMLSGPGTSTETPERGRG